MRLNSKTQTTQLNTFHYKWKFPKMAELVKNYHNNLQNQNITTQNKGKHPIDIEQALEIIPAPQKLEDPEHSPISQTATRDHVQKALRNVKNNTATRMDGCPYELWKILDQHHMERHNQNKPTFDITKILMQVF